jgi:hypothetical protein
MTVHNPLNAFSFDISLIEIGQEIKLLEHLKKNWITCIWLNLNNSGVNVIMGLKPRVLKNYR